MADEKLTGLALVTSAADTDLVYIVVDVGGTPTSKAMEIGDLRTRNLDSLADVPAYPNDGNFHILVERNELLTWELLPTAAAGNALQLSAAYSNENVTDLTESTSVPVWSKYIRIGFNLTDWLFDVVTVPTGGAITLDVHKNGTTIFSTKPTIAAGANLSTGAVITTASFAPTDFCEVFIDVVGTTTTGKGLKGDPIGTLI